MPARPPPTIRTSVLAGSGCAARRQRASRRRDCGCTTRSTKKPSSSSDASAIAPIGTGRTGRRGVATGSSASSRPWCRAIIAAIWRWQLRPWQRPIAGAGEALDDVEVGRGLDRRARARRRDLLAAADDGLGRRQLVDARPDACSLRSAAREALLLPQPPADRRARRSPASSPSAPRSSAAPSAARRPSVDRDVRPGDAGAVARREDPRRGRAHATRRRSRPGRRGPRRSRSRSRRAEAARPRGRTRSRGRARRPRPAPRVPATGPPVGVDGGVDDLLDPAVALRRARRSAGSAAGRGRAAAPCGSAAASRSSVTLPRAAAGEPERRRGARAPARPRARRRRSRRSPRSCAGNASASGPLPANTISLPGSTRCVLTSVCAPPAVITPGSVQPGKTTGPVVRARREQHAARA